MAANLHPPESVSPLTARKTWRTVEPLHGMVYFAPESSASYAELGLKPEAGYFASRSAAMGAVGAETVIATFYNFNPELVRAAIPAAWEVASPEAVLRARLAAADSALRRMLGDAVASPEMQRAASLARRAAERAAGRSEGRPLFAAHAGLPWPEPPHLVLWHAQTLLREFRGDGHITALVDHDLDPVEVLVMHLASGEVPGTFLRDTRGWPDADWEAGIDRLEQRGLVERPGSSADEPPLVGLSTKGADMRADIEDTTDRLAVVPYEAIGEEGSAELRSLARPFSLAVVAAAGFGA
jgi:DNA-binding MarR family transcriptional regulator